MDYLINRLNSDEENRNDPLFLNSDTYLDFRKKMEMCIQLQRNVLRLDRLRSELIALELHPDIRDNYRVEVSKLLSNRISKLYDERNAMVARYRDDIDDSIFFVREIAHEQK